MPDPSIAPALREALHARAFHRGCAAGGARPGARRISGHRPGVRPHAGGRRPRAVLARLFLLGLEVGSRARGVGAGPCRAWTIWWHAGFLERRGERLACPIRITPFEGLLLAHDPEPISDPAADIVTGLNSAARTLASLTPRRPTGRALDIGTGSGVQALLAATHCDEVVATDVNERALAFTRLGAALSGLRQRGDQSRQLLRPGGGRGVRPDRVQSAVRDLAGRRAGLPRRRAAGR